MKLYTIGFTRKPAERFFGLLRGSGARRLLDVRLRNESQMAGFAKKADLAWLLHELCGMEYHHLLVLAPTDDLLTRSLRSRLPWRAYEEEFLALLHERRVEHEVAKDLISDGCLLCAEDSPAECHRRLVAEYLRERWGDVEIVHLR